MITLAEVDAVLQGLSKIESLAEPELALIPGVNAIVPFLGLFKVVAAGVDIVSQAEGVGAATAKQMVIDHNTPGAPAAPALGPTASPPA